MYNHKIMDNYGGWTGQLDWIKTVTYNLLSAKTWLWYQKGGKLQTKGVSAVLGSLMVEA